MSKPNFGALLDAPPSEDDRPKSLPVGSYLCLVRGLPRFDKSSKKQTEFVEFTLVFQQAGSDVDEDELAEILKDTPLSDKTMKATFYLTEASVFMLNDFLEACAIESDGRTRRQMLDDTPNCEVVAYIRHEARQDGNGIRAQFGKFAKAEDFVPAVQEEAA